MKVGILAPDPLSGVPLALSERMKSAGHAVSFLNGGGYRKREIIRRVEVMFVYGARGPYGDAIDDHVEAMIPTFVVDLSPVLRAEDYQQFGEMGLNGLPPDADTDRIGLADRVKALKPGYSPEGPVILLGQKPNDAQHEMGAREMVEYYNSVTEKIHGVIPDLKIYWRPHPRPSGRELPTPKGAERCADRLNDLPICDAINALRPRAVVTYNSTGAFEAIMARVPAFAHASAFYADIATDDLSLLEEPESALPKKAALDKLLARLSWMIWKPEEFGSEQFCAHIAARVESLNDLSLGPREQIQAERDAERQRMAEQAKLTKKVRRGTFRARSMR